MIRRALLLFLLGLLGASTQAAEWRLDSDRSSLSFVSLKNVDVAEAHYFRQLSGSIASDGTTRVAIHVESVDTRVPIRDERMLEHLFGASEYPLAEVRAAIDLEPFRALAPGDSLATDIRFELDFRDRSVPLSAAVRVTALESGDLEVVTTAPVLLSAHMLDATAGVRKLQELAGLQSISMAVPVYFTLRFDHVA